VLIVRYSVLEEYDMITVLAGGTGSVKLVRGLVAQESKVNVISNVGDNYWLYGLYVCPDIDTIVYGLADLLDQERGWGMKKDTFNFLRQMEVFGEETWFRVGDRDAATHLIRTNMLKNGKNLSDITKWMCEKEGIQYIGADKARPNPEAVNAIHDADMVILAPGNPLTSIGPMLQIKGIRKELSKIKKKVVAVSPLIGDNAISGPAAKYMQAAGIESNAYGLAKMYSDVCANIIVDPKDKMLVKKIQSLDMKVFETKITMKNKIAEDALANFILKQVHV
jgi:LPPG:FO 2-phospho-L-lactate transferase